MHETDDAAPVDLRAVTQAAEDALDALVRFGKLERSWNKPDDEHTRFQIRSILTEALKEVFDDGE